MNTGPDIVASGYVVMGLISLAMAFVLAFLVRGRRHRVTPACPRCRYCLTGTASTTCPECGHDLSESGVYLHGRNRWPRLIRAIIVIAMALLVLLPYRYVTLSYWDSWATNMFGVPASWAGSVTGNVMLNPDRCRDSQITVIYPDPAQHGFLPATSPGDLYYWNPPEPVRVMMVQADGNRRDYVIESVSSDHQRWEIRRVQPMVGPAGPAFSADPAVAERPEDFYRVIGERIDRDGDTAPGEDPGPRVAATFAQIIIESMLAEDMTFTLSWRPSESGAVAHSSINSAASRSTNRPSTQGPWIMLASWFLFWLIVLLIVIAPGSPTDPWEPALADPGTDSDD
ncbi:MAG: hypothetical protein MK116_03280 [Phycisphaerales bacterium]|nr:hypothetical protein [Phycisphaerales bacterium]